MSSVKLKDVYKRYGSLEVIQGLELAIDSGEFCVFVGPSGCGKSTLLRMIAGLEEISEGSIHIGTRDVTHVDAAMRGIAMVFQTYALYPHMTVEENIGFGLRMNGVEKHVIAKKVERVAKTLKLEPYLKRKPKALSGGQRQRVAIGRALVRGPEVFLFDEPLSNLDAELRVDMRVEIARLHKEIGTTMIYVTHDQVEAMTLADKIVVLREGKIEQIGDPMELYSNPVNKFVAGFIGSPAMNFLKGKITDGVAQSDALLELAVACPSPTSQNIILGIRPEHLRIDPQGTDFEIDIIERLGGVVYIYANSVAAKKSNPDEAPERLVIEHKERTVPKLGARIGVSFGSENVFIFEAESGQRLS